MLVNIYMIVMVSAWFQRNFFSLQDVSSVPYILNRRLLQFAQKRSLRMKKVLVLYTSADPE